MGVPNYILELNATKQTVIDRYLKKEGQETLNEEDEDEVNKIKEFHEG
jgi:hypothetical protein